MINIRHPPPAYREALEHFLTALTSQHSSLGRTSSPASPQPNLSQSPAATEGGKDPPNTTQPLAPTRVVPNSMSENIWASVKTTLLLMNRGELLEACDSRRLDQLNAEFNDGTAA